MKLMKIRENRNNRTKNLEDLRHNRKMKTLKNKKRVYKLRSDYHESLLGSCIQRKMKQKKYHDLRMNERDMNKEVLK